MGRHDAYDYLKLNKVKPEVQPQPTKKKDRSLALTAVMALALGFHPAAPLIDKRK